MTTDTNTTFSSEYRQTFVFQRFDTTSIEKLEVEVTIQDFGDWSLGGHFLSSEK